MNLIEAVRSGKPFKRPRMPHFYDERLASATLTKEDILADDWETQEEKIEITREQLINAMMQARHNSYHIDTIASDTADILGFKND